MTSWQMLKGDALAVLRDLPDGSVDAVVTDPPYSSGGMMRGDRTNSSASQKYVTSGAAMVGDFTGDNRDQRSFAYWSTLWMSECQRVVRPGGLLAAFTDWRQLPTTTDAVQAGGWVWRGLFVWNKTGGRPMRGGFRNQSEYVVWASNGPMPKDSEFYGPGYIVTPIARGAEKQHITAKPVTVMDALVRAVPEGGVVLDPFAGSGSTGVAALLAGRNFIGVEMTDHYHAVAVDRLTAAQAEAA